MTIAIALKVGDCIVFGADSASTLSNEHGGILNVYFNAEKVFNLRKGLPVGAVTYGVGNLGNRSVTSLAKDLRERLSEGGRWELDKIRYTIEEVARRTEEFFYTELYRNEWPKKRKDPSGKAVDAYGVMGFMIGGYSGSERKGEVWTVEVDEKGHSTVARKFGPDEFGAEAKGQPEPLYRLINGWSPRVLQGLVKSGIPEAQAMRFLQSLSVEPLVAPGMPIQDAIDLVRYLIQVTAGFVQFIPGAPTVHEPIDVAAISYHEGFRWVSRKHYYSPELNPALP
jgi:hypothetical protein